MQPSDASVDDFLAGVVPARRQQDADALVHVMRRVTKTDPVMWGSIVGFGQYHYRYASGREGDAPAAAFSPRKAASTIYLADGVEAHAAALSRLGPHTTGVGCLYLKSLEDIDMDVLEQIVQASFDTVRADTFGTHG